MKYRLKAGKKHGGLKPGDVVDLTESQARAFTDRFEPVVTVAEPGKAEAPEPPAPAPETAQEPEREPEAIEAPETDEKPRKRKGKR